jgi:precorrin-4/cobalt-precorrin-4 C11-methyltransferase
MNQLYCIGAGPGDPDYLTLQGARLLAGCKYVFLASPYERTFADLLQDKVVLFPFAYDFEELVEKIRSLLHEAPVALLIPGDLTFFAPFQALIDRFGDRALVVPGVGSANVASALLKKCLHQAGVCNRVILTSTRVLGEDSAAPDLEALAAPGVMLLIYMNTLPLGELVNRLRKGYKKNVPIAICHRLGLPGQEIILSSLDEIVDRCGQRDYFNREEAPGRKALTLVLVGESLTATASASWWDLRREQIWKHQIETPDSDDPTATN